MKLKPSERLLVFTSKGIYCPAGEFYIDPWRPVEHAVVSHAHSDHAFHGMKQYYATPLSAAVMRLRLGADITVHEHEYGQPFVINGVSISLHPAGHVPGSAQIRIEHAGRVWVGTGDYKVEDDGLSTPFEQLECEGMITEATFGLPIYNWRPQAEIAKDIMDWWQTNAAAGKTSLLYGYSFGKAQRLLHMVNSLEVKPPAEIYGHGAVYNVTEVLRQAGLELPELLKLPDARTAEQTPPGALVLAPPSAGGSAWTRRFKNRDEAFVSGWMSIRSSRRSRSIGRGFTMSDHADWAGLLQNIERSKATFVQPFCGSKNQLSRYMREEMGLDAPDSPAGRYNAPADNRALAASEDGGDD